MPSDPIAKRSVRSKQPSPRVDATKLTGRRLEATNGTPYSMIYTCRDDESPITSITVRREAWRGNPSKFVRVIVKRSDLEED